MKKGQVSLYFEWILKFIAVIIVVIALFVFAGKYVDAPLDTFAIEENILVNAMKYKCLIYEQNVGVIDLSKLNDDHLKQCHAKPNLGYAITVITQGQTTTAKYFSSSNQEKILPVCDAIKDYRCSKRKEFVLVQTEKGREEGFITFEVINNVG